MSAETAPGGAWVPENTFAMRLAMVRARQKWNCAKAGEACGIDGESWRLYERGRRPFGYEDVCRKIADATGCDFVWLLTGQMPVTDR
ncbi:MAG: hypothetical protein QOJ92_273 [Frankiales bacterium]|nr:hypothetical protein [Frankiales bacterium]